MHFLICTDRAGITGALSPFLLCVMLCLFTLFNTVASSAIYVSIAIGRLFPGHRILCSFISIVLFLNLWAFSQIFAPNNVLIGDTAARPVSSIGLGVFLVTITAIPEYIATCYVMKRKLILYDFPLETHAARCINKEVEKILPIRVYLLRFLLSALLIA